jgi:membrane protein DedA with SNARE-associated domain
MRRVGWLDQIPINYWFLSLAIIAAVLSAIEIIDFPEIPYDTTIGSVAIPSIFLGLVGLMFTAGYVGLFVLMFLENMALPIPSELFLPLSGYFVYLGKMTFAIALLVSATAGLLGSVVLYLLALILGRPVIYAVARKLGSSEQSLIKSEAWLSAGGGAVLIFVARFVPGIRSSISIPAGVLKMNLPKFAASTALGTVGWSALLIYIGYSIGPYWRSAGYIVSSAILTVGLYTIAVVSLFYLVLFARKKLFHRSFIQKI